MTKFKVGTCGNVHFDDAFDCASLEEVESMLRPIGFEPATVWRYVPLTSHWKIIFDTSLPDSGRLPASLYWCNVAQNEKE